MLVDVMSTTVTWRLQASAASGSSSRGLRGDERAGAPSNAAVQDLDRNVLGDRGRIVLGCRPSRRNKPARMPFEGQRGRTMVDVDDRGIGGHHPVDVGPDLNLGGVERRADNRRRVIRAAAAERGRDAGGRTST